jgi:hypothetical protein
VVIPTSSYLQALSADDAAAFVSSLQTVKDHLRGELEWMTQQVQQKTLQLQGIETLLAEYEMLDPSALQTQFTDGAEVPLSSSAEGLEAGSSDSIAEEQNQTQSSTASATVPSQNTIAIAKPQQPSKSSKSTNTKSKPTTAKKTKPAGKSSSQAGKSSGRKELRDLLLPKFAGQSLTDAVAQILAETDQSLHLNQLLAEMYGTLTEQDFQRAKVSLANVLSVGKKEGKWQNLGEGLYAAL